MGNEMRNCSGCHQQFDDSDLVRIGGNLVCAGCKPEFLRRLQEGEKVEDGDDDGELRFAGFWIRVVAKFIDGFILQTIILPFIFISWIFFIFFGVFLRTVPEVETLMLVFVALYFTGLSLLTLGIDAVYQGWFLCRKGATPGKMIFRLKVINADGSEKITFWKGFGRSFAQFLNFQILYLTVAFDEHKQGLHDHLCKTLVVYKPAGEDY